MRRAGILVSFLAIFTTLSCISDASAADRTYISPDGTVDIVVAEVRADATVSTPYVVSLVPHGKQPDHGDWVLKIDRAAMPTAAWLGNDAASIRCSGARIWDFRNFWQMKTSQGEFRNVAIVLACGEKGYPGPAE